jgi:hypothetical protein
MAFVVADRVQETATANTTVSFTLNGAVTGFRTFNAGVGANNTTYYSSTDASGNWEVGLGTLNSLATTLTRTTILSSSNSGSAVTFSGTVNVFVTYPASKAVFSPSGVLAQNTQVFTSGTAATYTAPANTQWVKITVVGPGGNGIGASGARATGGGGGAVAIKWLSMTAGQTLTYTVGTSSGTASTVSSGTLTISTITANSGSNGSTTVYAASITTGPAGGAATGGDVNITGGLGGTSYGSSTTVSTNFSGKGGDCPGFGSGGAAVALVATVGNVGQGYGAGAAGSHGSNTNPSGQPGIIIFEAY